MDSIGLHRLSDAPIAALPFDTVWSGDLLSITFETVRSGNLLSVECDRKRGRTLEAPTRQESAGVSDIPPFMLIDIEYRSGGRK